MHEKPDHIAAVTEMIREDFGDEAAREIERQLLALKRARRLRASEGACARQLESSDMAGDDR
jgi:hypothetical protein